MKCHYLTNKRLLILVGILLIATLFVNAGNEKLPLLWESGEELNSFISAVAYSPDGKIVTSAGWNKTTRNWEIRLWDARQGRMIANLTGHNSFIYSLAFSSDGQTLASGSSDQTIKLWKVSGGRLITTLKGHKGAVFSVAFSPDGKTLASGCEDQTVKLWNAATGKLLKTLTAHTSFVGLVTYSPDGKILASGSVDKTIKLWDATTGKLIATLTGHPSNIESGAYSPDGKILAAGCGDGTINLWDASGNTLIRTVTGHDDFVASIAFSPDSKIFTSGGDKTVKFWDVSTGALLTALTDKGGITSAAFSPDGQTLISGNKNGNLKLWDVSKIVQPPAAKITESPPADVSGQTATSAEETQEEPSYFEYSWLKFPTKEDTKNYDVYKIYLGQRREYLEKLEKQIAYVTSEGRFTEFTKQIEDFVKVIDSQREYLKEYVKSEMEKSAELYSIKGKGPTRTLEHLLNSMLKSIDTPSSIVSEYYKAYFDKSGLVYTHEGVTPEECIDISKYEYKQKIVTVTLPGGMTLEFHDLNDPINKIQFKGLAELVRDGTYGFPSGQIGMLLWSLDAMKEKMEVRVLTKMLDPDVAYKKEGVLDADLAHNRTQFMYETLLLEKLNEIPHSELIETIRKCINGVNNVDESKAPDWWKKSYEQAKYKDFFHSIPHPKGGEIDTRLFRNGQNMIWRFPIWHVLPANNKMGLPPIIIEVTADSNRGKIIGAGGYQEGELVYLTAVANEGFAFVEWTEKGEQVSAEQEYTFTAEKHRELTANFAYLGGPKSTAEQTSHNVGDVKFNMRLAPGGLTFPTGMDDNGTATNDRPFWIAETPVTYELWHKVYTWATHANRGANRYYFNNSGWEGSHGSKGQAPTEKKNEPVTKITWHDAMVWCNALTEYYNAHHGTDYACVYTYEGRVVRDARYTNINVTDHVIASENAKGFRLSTSNEWELAARYIGPTQPTIEPLRTEAIYMSGVYWTPGEYASGAVGKGTVAEQEAGCCEEWSKTEEVGQRPLNGNSLGLYDMSGNVWEWGFTITGKNEYYKCIMRARRGLGKICNRGPISWEDVSSYYAFASDINTGLRLIRSK